MRFWTVPELFFYLGDKYFKQVFLQMLAGNVQGKLGELTETAAGEFPRAVYGGWKQVGSLKL